MLFDQLKTQWDNVIWGENNVTRVPIEHSFDCFVGYDASTHKSLIFQLQEEHPLLPTSDEIHMERFQQRNGKWRYLISLQSPEHEDIFLCMCADLLEYSQNEECEKLAFQKLADRYGSWLKMMKHGRMPYMSEDAQRGLLGELRFLSERLSCPASQPLAIVKGWQGPDAEPKDFFYGNEWFEIKTVLQRVEAVHISSMEQLDAPGKGTLILYTLARGGENGEGSITLNQAVANIRKLLQGDGDALLLFEEKLLQVGYTKRDEYDQKSYVFIEMSCYDVRDDFPRVNREMLPEAVGKLSYDLNIRALEPWKKA